MRKLALTLASIAGAAMLAVSTFAAETTPITRAMLADIAIRDAGLLRALESGGDPEAGRGLYWAVKIWPKQYRELRVCFFGGTDEARALIAEYASDWNRADASIKFDFGEPGKQRSCDPSDKVESQIRVGFDDNAQMQSAAGVDSVTRYPQDVPSINLVQFGSVTRASWNDAYHTSNVRHEFGHALGLMHEHQSSSAPCEEEFDWEKIYEWAGGNREAVDNMLRRLPADQFIAGPFDVKSIMMYQFPDWFFKAGDKAKCYPPELNLKVSDGDLEQLAKLYPKSGDARAALESDLRARFMALWSKADPKVKSGVGFDPMTTYFREPAD